ncbi:ABC transporter permease [Desulfotalea psychrophila]|uniref:Conserved hypothetical membrane protein n=1 Tax=Desulfotalea psychrophila (strain LSv54 / DSM 12343) TaxID=177439 RepID=Q6AN03_DESPS|nr:ABC transporter permease [Desulfotalea psychrophila]CAG36271.1 conserved hypothetical membrane protein [Desulfotalea psychrophila LSv54]
MIETFFSHIFTLIGKEFTIILRDPKSRIIVILPPLIQFFIFGYAATFDLNQIPYAVLDESHSPKSRQLLALFAGSENFHLVTSLSSNTEAREMLNRQEVRLIIHIPSEFDKTTAGSISAITDGRNSNVAAVSLGYVQSIIGVFNARQRGDSNIRQAPYIIGVAWFNENLQSRWFIVSALGAVISMIVVMILSALSVAREREFGTFDQLLVAPFSSTEILIGKAIPCLVLGLFDALILSLGAIMWFDIPFRGTFTALCLILLVFVLAIVGIGLFISAICSTMQQALLGAFIFIMPTVLLSGFTTPIANMPDWLQTITYLTPLRYAVNGLRQIFLAGADSATVWPQIWPMILISSCTLPLARWMFNKRS